jgi:GxxExxY protein
MGTVLDDLPAELNRLSERIIGAAIEVHRALGPGLLERLYEEAFVHELELAGLRVRRQAPVSLVYKGKELVGQRLDLVIEELVVVELKAVEKVLQVHLAQLVGYLLAGDYPLGLLLNFNVPKMRNGIHRRVNSRVLTDVPFPPMNPSALSATPPHPPRTPPC